MARRRGLLVVLGFILLCQPACGLISQAKLHASST